MHTSPHAPLRRRYAFPALAAAIALGMLVLGRSASAQPADPAAAEPKPAIQIPAGATVGSLFKDFMHYARIGRFTLADAYAKAMFAHPEFEPGELIKLADKDAKTLETLLILIRRSSIADTASRVLDALRLGEQENRKTPQRILQNIELLGGDPQQEYFARNALRESGEYAVPFMLDTLLDPAKKTLWPRVITALPFLGKDAVHPLVISLGMSSNDVRLNVISAIGDIGYPDAIPYLRRLTVIDSMPPATKDAAARAIRRIEEIAGRSLPGSAEQLFVDLSESYFSEDDSVRADPRLETANVWYWNADEQTLRSVVVPQRIFGQVMAMRCAEEALRLQTDNAAATAMWLAANIRREYRLGLNVESGNPDETGETDATRPEVFPRALYFTQSAGPRYAHPVLDRATRDQDAAVALGAIAALRVTAGEASLGEAEDYKRPLVKALQFPDLVVRTRAALALGAALPRTPFTGSELVVPLLAATLAQTGREQILVVAGDEAVLNRVVGDLRSGDRDVIGERSFFNAMQRARAEFQSLAGVYLSTDVVEPGVSEALQRLRGEFVFSKTPVVLLTQASQSAMAADLGRSDPYLELVDDDVDAASLGTAFARVRARTGQTRFDAQLALSVALEAAETLRRIAADGRTVYDPADAEPALIAALSAKDEQLQIRAASVLALLPAPTAQRAVAHVALTDTNTASLRIAAFDSLAECAKNHGNQLEPAQIDALVGIAKNDPDLVMRTAASKALGAVNLTTSKASEIIRGFYGG